MLSRFSLFAFAVILTMLAVVVARRGHTTWRDAVDGGAALIGTSLFLAASVASFAAWQPSAASAFWWNAGSATLMACPLGATLALRYRGRRSMPRALAASALAHGCFVLWLILNLRGPRGGWTLIDIVLVLPAAAMAVASAACLGWWSKSVPAKNLSAAAGR